MPFCRGCCAFREEGGKKGGIIDVTELLVSETVMATVRGCEHELWNSSADGIETLGSDFCPDASSG